MFSGTGTPPPARTPRRAASRAARSVSGVVQSGDVTPRASTPPAGSLSTVQQQQRSLGMGLHAASRALSASPAPSLSGRRSRSVAALSEAGSAMDLDERDGAATTTAGPGEVKLDKVLVKDEAYVVSERKGLPQEVEQIVVAGDPYTDPFRATLDSATGFALLVSRDYCFVWNWSKRSATATTYIFPLPTNTSLPTNISTFTPLAFASFVPSAASHQQAQREPGLLTVSTTGSVRLWESISMALSGVDRFKTAVAPLHEGELVRGLERVSSSSFLLSTSQSRVLLIAITSVGGRIDLSVRALERSVGWAGSVWSAVFGARAADPRAGILALALGAPNAQDGKRVAYALDEKTVQVWELPARDDGSERLAIEQDVFAGILEALSGEAVGNEEWAMNHGKVEIVDAVVAPSGSLAILISHVAPHTASGALSYAIVSLDVGTTQNSVTVAGVRHLSYQARPDPRPLSTPRLSFNEGTTAFVVFVDAVVMLSVDEDSVFEETFPLRINTHRFLGISTPSPAVTAAGKASLSLLTSTGTVLSIQVTAPQTFSTLAPGSEGYKTRKLKTKIEQAIFYGSNDADNPLAFDLLPDYEGDLMAAAESVSAEILASASANMPLILDLRAQLADRVVRSRALIEFINSNGLLGKLSQSSRRQLSWDAERLAAAVALWHDQNARLGSGDSLLAESIGRFMEESGDGFAEDPLRTFFRTKISSLGKIADEVTKETKRILSAPDASIESSSAVLQEANQILLLIFNAVARHRKDSSKVYGLDATVISAEPWSSRPSLLEGLQWHFETTEALLHQRVRDFGSALEEESTKYGALDLSNQQAMQAELKKQLTSLAEVAFPLFEERLLFLHTIAPDGVPSPEARNLTERYLSYRPRAIRTLVSIGKVLPAYELAERHRDFRALVELCNDSRHGSASRLQYFMNRYAEDFAFPLYQFYIEKAQYRTLLEQDEVYRPLLTSFLDSTNNPDIAWLNDIAIGRFANAADCLVGEAIKEQKLASKKLMLSLGKLTQVAQADKETIDTEPVQRALEAVDDIIDLVNSQEELCSVFSATLSGGESRQSVEDRSQTVTDRVAPGLASRPAFAELYTQVTLRLLQGRTLSPEDLIDLLTLKENLGEQAGDYAAALEILVRAKDMPEARKRVALQNIWRRVYLRDDWTSLRAAVGLRDEELADALRSTAFSATLTAAAGANHPPALFLEPAQALFTGSREEVAARFPEAPASTIEELLRDYEAENDQVQHAIQHSGLDSFCQEVVRLLHEATEENADDSMVVA